MNMQNHVKPLLCLVVLLNLLFSACKKEDGASITPLGSLRVELTDAPIDNPEVSGAFVTLAGIRLDGDTSLFDRRITIDLLAYQDGNTKDIGQFQVPVGTYQEVELIFDIQQDAQGFTPGCFIATQDGKRHNLAASTQLYKSLKILDQAFSVEPDRTTSLLIDFDLRKAIRMDTTFQSIKYQFVSDQELSRAIRLVEPLKAGSISGKLDHLFDTGQKIILHAYPAGRFSENQELQGTGPSRIPFANASNSTLVKQNGSFYLPFMPRGSYQLVLVSYLDRDRDGVLEYQGILQASRSSGLLLEDIYVEAGNDVFLELATMEIDPV